MRSPIEVTFTDNFNTLSIRAGHDAAGDYITYEVVGGCIDGAEHHMKFDVPLSVWKSMTVMLIESLNG